MTHGNVVQLVCGQAYARFEPDETFLHWSALSFDASTLEIWGALLCGARLVVAPPRMDVLADLPGLLRRQRVTVAFVTTSLFHELVDLDVTTFDGLRQVLVGGERLALPHARRMVRHAREVPAAPEVINGYGPTETTTFATWFPLRELTGTDGDVPIGRPLARGNETVPTVVLAGKSFVNPDRAWFRERLRSS
ncbi:AMP-binding protein [Micromonospora sp. NPDC005298]|uniref:AMP-binding protein n=1 Tax=Micromonospora sp. NPDC005298 TaxID=3156873 RepID=UPI0033B8D8ED